MEMSKFRDITEKEIEEINKLFTGYLFYETLPSGERLFECSHCNKIFTVGQKRVMHNEDYELITAGHNEDVRCPKCGKICTVKNKGKAKSCKNLYEEQRVVVFHKINKNYIQAVCRIAVKQYSEYCHRPKVQFLGWNQSNYIFRPGTVVQYKKSDYYGFHQTKVASEPFTPKTSMSYWTICDNSYTLIGFSKLMGSFLRYNGLLEYISHYTEKREKIGIRIIEPPMMRYICRFTEYPQIEILQKLGFWEVIEKLVESGLKSYPYVNWKANDLCGFFKMSKQEFNLFRKSGGDLDLLKVKAEIKNITGDCDISKAVKYSDFMPEKKKYDYFMAVKERFGKRDILQVLKYIHKQANKSSESLSNTRREYFDYLDMAKKLKYDLKNEVVFFPKNLRNAHDIAVETYNAQRAEEEAKKNAEKEKKAKKFINKYKKLYCFSDGEFLIMVPTTTAEIIREGKEQCHCVGGYAARHLEGKLAICFLRSITEPDKALYTIEMHEKEVKQIQGYKNSTPLTPQAELFFEKWKLWVKQGSPRDKKGNPKLAMAK